MSFVRAAASSEQILIVSERRSRAHSWCGGESAEAVDELTHVSGELGTRFGEVRSKSLHHEPCLFSVDCSHADSWPARCRAVEDGARLRQVDHSRRRRRGATRTPSGALRIFPRVSCCRDLDFASTGALPEKQGVSGT